MLSALSIRHNTLVLAEDCTHKSYANLALICSYCSKPVHLNQGRKVNARYKDGKLKRKAYSTESYFCHFRGEGQDCENRASAIGKTELRKRVKANQVRAKQQRLKIIEQRIEQIFSFPVINHHVNTACAMAYSAFNPKRDRDFELHYRQDLTRFRKIADSLVYHRIPKLSNNFFSSESDEDNIWHQSRYNHLKYLQDPFELSQHLIIVREVAKFLLAPANHKLFFNFYINFDYQSRLTHTFLKFLEKQNLDPEKVERGEKHIPLNCALYGLNGLFIFPGMDQSIVVDYDSQDMEIDNLTAQYFVTALLCTPWAIGFEIAQTKTAPPDFAIWKREAAVRIMTGIEIEQWLLINTENSICQSALGNLDLLIWLSNNLHKQAPFMEDEPNPDVDRHIQEKTIMILPGSYSNLSVALEVKNFLDYNEPIKIVIFNNQTLTPLIETQLWVNNESKKFQKWAKKKYDRALANKITSPWSNCWQGYLMIHTIEGENYTQIMLALVNAYLFTIRTFQQHSMINA